jgi:Ca2+-binding EF-hand superfamily protein
LQYIPFKERSKITSNFPNRYDFNKDGFISKEDVRIVLSYVPFKRLELQESEVTVRKKLSSMNFNSAMKEVVPVPSKQEGLYEEHEGKALQYKDRLAE